MTHPCFSIPRQSGWGDEGRKLSFRRVDGYLTARRIPIRLHGRRRVRSHSYHRPLHSYLNALSAAGFLVERIDEEPGGVSSRNLDIPALLGVSARKDRRA